MSTKQRLSASVDSDLIAAAEDAVKRGVSPSVSSWVNEALRLKLAHERRLEALSAFIKAYEIEQGEITPEEMRMATRRARARALTVRGVREEKRTRMPRRRRR
jgi:Arc/MetJ-type ribon-helix-helix transcriptional regulator